MEEKNGGSSPSRDMAMSTRAEPSIMTSRTDVSPARAAASSRVSSGDLVAAVITPPPPALP